MKKIQLCQKKNKEEDKINLKFRLYEMKKKN